MATFSAAMRTEEFGITLNAVDGGLASTVVFGEERSGGNAATAAWTDEFSGGSAATVSWLNPWSGGNANNNH
jgi:hypothetical protein